MTFAYIKKLNKYQIRFLPDTLTDTGTDNLLPSTNLQGYLGQLYQLKQQHRNLKVLLSIGGQQFSLNFARALNSSGAATFASSVVYNVQTYGFDGVDIDWQYPANNLQAANLVHLLKAVRDALNAYGESLSTPYNFALTVTGPGPFGYQHLHLAEMDQYVDFWNLMAYDYAGPWSRVTANQANLFASLPSPASTPFNTKAIVEYYISQGILPAKIVLGMPLYGHAFNNTTNRLGEPFNGTSTYSVKDLPLSGATEYYDISTGSCYSYDPIQRQVVSYDSIPVAKQKAAWIRDTRLGGAMFWESSEDRAGSQSIIQNVALVLGGNDSSGLDSTPNRLFYPDSIYQNLNSSSVSWTSSISPTYSSSLATLTSAPVTTARHITIPCWGELAAGARHKC